MAQFNGSQASYDEGTGKFTFSVPDAVVVNGSPLPQRVMLRKEFNANSVDDWVFIADRAYTVVSIKEVHSVAGNDASAVTLDVRKVTDASAPGASGLHAGRPSPPAGASGCLSAYRCLHW